MARHGLPHGAGVLHIALDETQPRMLQGEPGRVAHKGCDVVALLQGLRDKLAARATGSAENE
ncbi:hypothetical protein GCM10028821_31990 [Hymenobacter jeollabukensis]